MFNIMSVNWLFFVSGTVRLVMGACHMPDLPQRSAVVNKPSQMKKGVLI